MRIAKEALAALREAKDALTKTTSAIVALAATGGVMSGGAYHSAPVTNAPACPKEAVAAVRAANGSVRAVTQKIRRLAEE
jgi:hypothetical protein